MRGEPVPLNGLKGMWNPPVFGGKERDCGGIYQPQDCFSSTSHRMGFQQKSPNRIVNTHSPNFSFLATISDKEKKHKQKMIKSYVLDTWI